MDGAEPPDWGSLPSEIWMHVCGFLSARDVVRGIGRADCRMRLIAIDDSLWRSLRARDAPWCTWTLPDPPARVRRSGSGIERERYRTIFARRQFPVSYTRHTGADACEVLLGSVSVADATPWEDVEAAVARLLDGVTNAPYTSAGLEFVALRYSGQRKDFRNRLQSESQWPVLQYKDPAVRRCGGGDRFGSNRPEHEFHYIRTRGIPFQLSSLRGEDNADPRRPRDTRAAIAFDTLSSSIFIYEGKRFNLKTAKRI